MQSIYFCALLVVSANARMLKFHDDSPIQIVTTTRNDGHPERVDHVEALILPKHLGDGSPADMSDPKLQDSFNQMKADGDQPGLLVPWQLGGPPVWFNFIPENIRVNPGDSFPSLSTDFYKIECAARTWLESGDDHQIKWIAEPQYEDDSDRPTEVNLQVQFLPGDQQISTTAHNPKACEDSMIYTSKQCDTSNQCNSRK